jgi:GTPase Era involved in 16S rRNA processing
MNNMEEFKSGFVSIIGKTNVGKSTLINKLVGEKVSIITPKTQTTRTRNKRNSKQRKISDNIYRYSRNTQI